MFPDVVLKITVPKKKPGDNVCTGMTSPQCAYLSVSEDDIFMRNPFHNSYIYKVSFLSLLYVSSSEI